jgi:tetratricopeptide (TPR) repeat protein
VGGGWKANTINFISGQVTGVAARDPAADRARLEAVQAAIQGRDMERAAALAEQAVKAGQEHPLLLNLTAFKLEREERLEEALTTLRRAVEIAPGDPSARQALGLLLLRLERHAEALAAFDAVLSAQEAFAPAHVARAEALAALGKARAAEEAYRRGLALQPGNMVAAAGLAGVLARRGDFTEARTLAERALAAQPDYPDAVMVLAQADLAAGDGAAAEARLQSLIADQRLSPVQRALAQGLLGDVLDAQGRVPEAFGAYAGCNMGLWRAYAPSFGQGVSALDFARESLDVLEDQGPDAWRKARPKGSRAPAREHVFLLGFPRSGTTLLEQVLAAHPDVEALEERETLADATRAFQTDARALREFIKADGATLEALREAYWRRVAEEGARAEGKVFVDKHPLDTFRLPLIARLFPEAKILFARRDPRDVVLSCYRRRFAMSSSAYQMLTLPGAAGFYDAAMRMAAFFEPVTDGRMQVVRHEALVEDFEAVTGEVCAFLGLAADASLRDFSARMRERGVATPSGAQLAGGLSAEGVGAWRRYRDQLAPVLPTLAPWAERFGYPAE